MIPAELNYLDILMYPVFLILDLVINKLLKLTASKIKARDSH